MPEVETFGGMPVRSVPGAFGGDTHTEFNLSSVTGTPPSKLLAGTGGEAEIVYVDVIVPAPPSTNGVGDWPMRFFAGELDPDVGGEPPMLYMCPDDSVLYIRYFEIINRSGSARTVKLFFADPEEPFEQVNISLASGSSIVSSPDFMFNIGEGEEIMGSASGVGVFCNVAGIETVS
jgi:hypothetical protein